MLRYGFGLKEIEPTEKLIYIKMEDLCIGKSLNLDKGVNPVLDKSELTVP